MFGNIVWGLFGFTIAMIIGLIVGSELIKHNELSFNYELNLVNGSVIKCDNIEVKFVSTGFLSKKIQYLKCDGKIYNDSEIFDYETNLVKYQRRQV